MTIVRIDAEARWSDVVIHNNTLNEEAPKCHQRHGEVQLDTVFKSPEEAPAS